MSSGITAREAQTRLAQGAATASTPDELRRLAAEVSVGSQSARFLQSEAFNDVVLRAYGISPEQLKNGPEGEAARKWLYHPEHAPVTVARAPSAPHRAGGRAPSHGR